MAKHSLLPQGTRVEIIAGIHKGSMGVITAIHAQSQYPYDIELDDEINTWIALPEEVKKVGK